MFIGPCIIGGGGGAIGYIGPAFMDGIPGIPEKPPIYEGIGGGAMGPDYVKQLPPHQPAGPLYPSKCTMSQIDYGTVASN